MWSFYYTVTNPCENSNQWLTRLRPTLLQRDEVMCLGDGLSDSLEVERPDGAEVDDLTLDT